MAWRFEWDLAKANANLEKHGIAFDKAVTVFADPLALISYDAAHSVSEERWLLVGWSAKRRPLTVWYTESGETIRLIGCRRATRREVDEYARQPGF
ncbi:MAG: BrnT family toxin [Fimbriimonadaceae bacterium]|nr:BrnT family toxin [Fimbriimonadaceae bacterium]